MAGLVSIVVVNWNKAEMTARCLSAIAGSMAGLDHEVIVVDNGSAPEEARALAATCAASGARLLPLARNLYFGEANNIGAEAARGDRLLLLNNDAFLAPGVIARLVDTLETAPFAGAVGPRFVYPDGRLQELGAFVRPDGWVVQVGKADGRDPGGPGRDIRVVDYCSAACLLVRRDLFLSLGGFDPVFDPAYYEDVDFALRLRAGGHFFYLDAGASVVHAENQTSATLWSSRDKLAVIRRMRGVFLERWGRFLRARLWYDARPPALPAIAWTPDPLVFAPDGEAIIVEAPGLLDAGPLWRRAIALAARLGRPTIFVADEACSRCRVLTLAAWAGLDLPQFLTRRRGDVPPAAAATHARLAPSFTVEGEDADAVARAWRALAGQV